MLGPSRDHQPPTRALLHARGLCSMRDMASGLAVPLRSHASVLGSSLHVPICLSAVDCSTSSERCHLHTRVDEMNVDRSDVEDLDQEKE